LQKLRNALNDKAPAMEAHHQDRPHPHPGCNAVTLGQEFSGYARQVENGIARIEQTMPLLMELPRAAPPSAPASMHQWLC
jgi:fumarate hydratase class II